MSFLRLSVFASHMERWNIGIMESWETKQGKLLFLSFILKPIIPSFHYSIIPIVSPSFLRINSANYVL
jgi:hypothetical protein